MFFFFFFSPVLGCLLLLSIVSSCLLPRSAVFLFVCFSKRRFCSLAINHISGPLPLCINYANIISELYQHVYWYTNILFTEESKQALRMILSCITSCKGRELWKLSTVLSTCHNWGLLITCTHKPLCFKKIRTTTRNKNSFSCEGF